MCGRLDAYLTTFSHLNSKKEKNKWKRMSFYRSPEVPLLLLSVIDQIHCKNILRNFLTPDKNLQSAYTSYMHLLGVKAKSVNIALPFCELSKTTFWRLLSKSSNEAASKTINPAETIEGLLARYHGARLAEDLYTILQMEHLRRKLGDILITTYFDEETARNIAKQSEIIRKNHSKNIAATD